MPSTVTGMSAPVREQHVPDRLANGHPNSLALLVTPRDAQPELGVAGHPEQAVGLVDGEHLVAQLFVFRHSCGEDVGRVEALHEVVVATVAVAPGDADDARVPERLEHGTRLVGWPPVPVDGGSALEVERRERPLRPDASQDALGGFGVRGQRLTRVKDRDRSQLMR